MPPASAMPARPPSLLARALAPLAPTLWYLFVLWTGLVAAVWIFEFGPSQLELITNSGLREALSALLDALDGIWVTLAAANVYLALAAEEGLAMARRRAGLVMGTVFVVALLSVFTHWPLGPLRYSARLGIRIGPVPFGLPLLWLVLVCGGRWILQRFAPKASHWQLAVGTGLLTLLSDLALEPLAWKARAFWVWYPSLAPAPAWPPIQNYLTWFIVGAALAFAMRDPLPGRPRPATSGHRIGWVWALLNLLLLATLLGQALRSSTP